MADDKPTMTPEELLLEAIERLRKSHAEETERRTEQERHLQSAIAHVADRVTDMEGSLKKVTEQVPEIDEKTRGQSKSFHDLDRDVRGLLADFHEELREFKSSTKGHLRRQDDEASRRDEDARLRWIADKANQEQASIAAKKVADERAHRERMFAILLPLLVAIVTAISGYYAARVAASDSRKVGSVSVEEEGERT